MREAFAVIPDGNSSPAAVFTTLEEAIDWGLSRYGSDSFRIRALEVQTVRADAGATGMLPQ